MKRKKWSLLEQGQFLTRLGQLMEKGYSLSHAIEFLQIQQSPNHQEDLKICLQELRGGISLHKALEKIHFHSDAVGNIFFAEQHGRLDYAVRLSGATILLREKYRSEIKKVTSYPVFLLAFIGLIYGVFQQFILPEFGQLSTSFYVQSSTVSTSIFSVISHLPNIFLSIIGMLIMSIIVMFIVFLRQPIYGKMKILMHIPWWKKVQRQFNSYEFAVQCSQLLESGLSIYESLQLFGRQEHMAFLQVEAIFYMKRLASGEHLEELIKKRGYYERELSLIIQHGQMNGELAKELREYSNDVFLNIEEIAKRAMKKIQPILLGGIGLFLMLMYVAILFPMFQVMNQL